MQEEEVLGKAYDARLMRRLIKYLKPYGQMGKIRSLVFNVGDKKLHIHHWILCLGFLISAVYFDFSFLFFSSILSGIFGRCDFSRNF